MQPFDVLSPTCPIFGPHLLEASAGTGKTFSIEHVVVRLLLESEEIEIEQILAVTFTRAATRELKKRIRSNIQEALFRIRSVKKGWEYLDPFLGSEKGARKLDDALLAFDGCQIFTIHKFCYRMLQEFAFEANLGFSLKDPDRVALTPKRIGAVAKKFVQSGIGPDLLCPEQMSELLKAYDTMDELVHSLLHKQSEMAALPFAALLEKYTALWSERIEGSELLETFRRIQPNYKAAVKGDFEKQIKALASSYENPLGSFRQLLREKGSLFDFLAPSNRKVSAKEESPPFFEWASRSILPLIREAMDPKKIFGCLQKAWKRIEEPILSEELFFGPDELLKRMREAIGRDAFASCVRKKYRAVIIDEFQDTDPLQWDIFKNLFLYRDLLAFYLVGDPKQSIYRFRRADIYTYFEARDLLGLSALYSLDTNYRSSSAMIGVLNALFDRNWLPLPKLQMTIPSPSVLPRSEASSDFSDKKGAVHFIEAHSFEDSSLPFAALEIERLMPLLKSPSSFAILVKDRYQADAALKLLRERAIPAYARSHTPLGKTGAFQAVREVIEALVFSRDPSLKRKVAAGPFQNVRLGFCRTLLEEEGIIPVCRQLLQGEDQDLKQVIEELLVWESREGFSVQGLLRFLDDLENLDPEEGGRRRVETDTEAVQILTLHVSKGLEFDVVFALGLSTRPPENEEEPAEADAEKLRQLYVAMTRAKRRLYVPLPGVEKSRGSLSPMELFCQSLEAQEGAFLPFLGKIENVTFENLPERVILPPLPERSVHQETLAPPPSIPSLPPCFLHSFTSLSQAKGENTKSEDTSPLFTAHTIPRGVETGILIHQIFEKLFSDSLPIWKDLPAVEALIDDELYGSPLLAWGKPIKEMIWKTLNLSLGSFSLVDLAPGQLQVEMEFLFSQPPHFVKGYIDLVFMHDGKIYFLDWKTNWLGPDDSAYLSLDDAMAAHDYWLQARIYTEALKRHVKRFYMQPFEEIFGGAIYLFLRGGGVCHFKP